MILLTGDTTEFSLYKPKEEPFYIPMRDGASTEIDIGMAALESKMPIMLKGPTGTGKTRFVEYLAYKSDRPLITVSCNEDTTANGLVGRFLLKDGETVWQKGPAYKAVEEGAILYLDEIVEARKDVMVVIHSLTDHRRILPVDALDTIIEAHPNFALIVSYNPGYQSVLKNLKPSTAQRFIAINFDYLPFGKEVEVVEHESGCDFQIAEQIVKVAQLTRGSDELKGLIEGASTREAIYAGKLTKQGISLKVALEMAIANILTDDEELRDGVKAIIDAVVA